MPGQAVLQFVGTSRSRKIQNQNLGCFVAIWYEGRFSDAKNTVFDMGLTRDTDSTSTVVQVGRDKSKLPVQASGQSEHWLAPLKVMLRNAFESAESALSKSCRFPEAIFVVLGEHKDEEGSQRRADSGSISFEKFCAAGGENLSTALLSDSELDVSQVERVSGCVPGADEALPPLAVSLAKNAWGFAAIMEVYQKLHVIV
jgi:hypothetical protein